MSQDNFKTNVQSQNVYTGLTHHQNANQNNFTSEASKDSICPLFISKETRPCIKGSIRLPCIFRYGLVEAVFVKIGCIITCNSGLFEMSKICAQPITGNQREMHAG